LLEKTELSPVRANDSNYSMYILVFIGFLFPYVDRTF